MKIKNRKSRGRTSRKKPTGRSKKKVPVGPAGWLRSNWDITKSGKFNYEQLGISQDPDEPSSKPFKKEVFNELTQNSTFVPTESKLQDWQKEILAVLVKRHGKDYKGMAKDIKINTWQWTKVQIKRMIELGFN